MSDFSMRPANEANSDGADASSDDSSSPLRPEAAKPQTSFWARAARIWRPAQGERLREDLADALMTDASVSNVFSPEERAMLHNILRFREVRVEDIMVPRADIEAIDQNMTVGDLMILFEESGRSRMPVYHETLDDPRGMVHIRDLLSYVARQARDKRDADALDGVEGRHGFNLGHVDLDKTVAEAGLIRKILFVPPSMLASDLMKSMQTARTQMALVIDEYGGTDGLASHEDIVEMVIGDIEDEHDDEEVLFTRTSDDIFVADARVELEDIAAAIGSDFDVRDQVEDVDTLGGLIFAELGRIPVNGEVVQALPGFEFHILDADQRRIKRVRILRKQATGKQRFALGETDAGFGDSESPTVVVPTEIRPSASASSAGSGS